MIKVTFPDGAVRDYAKGTTGTTIVEGISKSLAKKTVAMRWDGELADLSSELEADGRIEFVLRDDPAALELIRHDAAHVLAEAVQELWPCSRVRVADRGLREGVLISLMSDKGGRRRRRRGPRRRRTGENTKAPA